MSAITAPADPDSLELENRRRLARLREALGDASLLDDSAWARAYFSSDASIYRVVPAAVAQPRSRDELIRVARAALKVAMPITGRGAGTSLCGNSIGEGLIIDMGRNLRRVLEIDPETRTALVEPGVVPAALQAAAKPHGLRFGPDPATADRCAIGGMIGNNACGARALGYGRTSDNIVSLEVLTGTGEIVTLGQGGDDSAWPIPQLAGLVKNHLPAIRAEFGKFTRQISGYALEHLLPERFAPERFFVGSEGTLGIVLRARVKLVADAPIRQMIALGYARMDLAGDDILNLTRFQPTAAEGLDDRTIDVVRRLKGPDAVPPLPRGQAYIFVELAGENYAEVAERSAALMAAAHAVDAWKVDDPQTAATLWKIRSDAAGLAGIGLERPAYASWEDAAVPPGRIGDYLRDLEKLLARHKLHGLPYGHFGEGCIHCRIDFPLDRPGGVADYRAFMLEAADLVVQYGGSMSGEHGDGRARSELLGRMYSPESIALFAAVKHLFDPGNLLNPGVLVDPRPTDHDIRVAQTLRVPLRASDPAFVQRAHQCSGVSKCLADCTGAGGVMCPSYLATGNQLHSPRGRARMLQEMINGQIVRGWLAPELHAAFDLCLACKGCRKDCPADIDMAACKSHVLYESYKGRLRPLSHYALGWLPRWGRLVSRIPGAGGLMNFVLKMPGLKQIALRLAGIDTCRNMPPNSRPGRSIQSCDQTIVIGQKTTGIMTRQDALSFRKTQAPHGLPRRATRAIFPAASPPRRTILDYHIAALLAMTEFSLSGRGEYFCCRTGATMNPTPATTFDPPTPVIARAAGPQQSRRPWRCSGVPGKPNRQRAPGQHTRARNGLTRWVSR